MVWGGGGVVNGGAVWGGGAALCKYKTAFTKINLLDAHKITKVELIFKRYTTSCGHK